MPRSAVERDTTCPLSAFFSHSSLFLSSFPPKSASQAMSVLLFSFCNPQSKYNLSEFGLKKIKSLFPISIYISRAKNLKSPSTCLNDSNFDTCSPKPPVITPIPCKSYNFNKKQVTHQTPVLPERANTHVHSITNNS